MSGIKFTKHSYKIQSEKRLKENSGSGKVLRKLVYCENILVMNENQFRHFYKQFTTHELVGGDLHDLDCLKLHIIKELMGDILVHIDERGEYIEEESCSEEHIGYSYPQ